ncbi:MAG: hypothetical protein ACI95X_002798, partial [Paraglaciecola sp.]
QRGWRNAVGATQLVKEASEIGQQRCIYKGINPSKTELS